MQMVLLIRLFGGTAKFARCFMEEIHSYQIKERVDILMLDEVKTKVKKFAKENKNELICSAVIAGVGAAWFLIGVKGEKTHMAKLIDDYPPFAMARKCAKAVGPEGILLTSISDGLEPSDLIPLKDCGKIGEVFLKEDYGAKEDTMINGIMLFYND